MMGAPASVVSRCSSVDQGENETRAEAKQANHPPCAEDVPIPRIEADSQAPEAATISSARRSRRAGEDLFTLTMRLMHGAPKASVMGQRSHRAVA
jgi:hypothetical protein